MPFGRITVLNFAGGLQRLLRRVRRRQGYGGLVASRNDTLRCITVPSLALRGRQAVAISFFCAPTNPEILHPP